LSNHLDGRGKPLALGNQYNGQRLGTMKPPSILFTVTPHGDCDSLKVIGMLSFKDMHLVVFYVYKQ